MIGNMIQTKRKEAGFTQAQLAELLGVTPPAVNRWEKDLSFPDAALLAPLARCLKTDLNQLFSFYDSLSDKERELVINKAMNMLLLENSEEALVFMDKVVKENQSDGDLYLGFAKVLLGAHAMRKSLDPLIYLDKIVEYYERAMVLLPDQTEKISYSLVTIYAELGNKEKAEEAWNRLSSKEYDKRWVHAEMLYSLKEYEASLTEAQKLVLENVIHLYRDINFLRNMYYLTGQDIMVTAADEMKAEFRVLFGLPEEIEAVFDLVNSIETKDKDEEENALTNHTEKCITQDTFSKCPLFKDVELGAEDSTTANAIFRLFSALNKLDK